jgi:hypothetical protein
MRFNGFTEAIIIPFFHAHDSKISVLQKSLVDRQALRNFLNTPQFPYLTSIDLELTAQIREISNLDKQGKLGTFIVNIVASGSSLDEVQVPELIRRMIDWIKIQLVAHEVSEWLPNVYSLLILSNTDPQNIKGQLQANKKLLASLVFAEVPIDSHFTEDAIEKLMEETSYLENDLYCFSPYGSLVYDQNLVRSQKYLDTQIVPRIADFRAMQAFLEVLGKSLNEKIGEEQIGKSSNETFQEITSLRVTSLKALATIEYGRRLTHLADVSDKLTRMFGLDVLQKSIEQKVEALDSIAQALGDLRNQKIQTRLTWANVLLAAITVLLGLLAYLHF